MEIHDEIGRDCKVPIMDVTIFARITTPKILLNLISSLNNFFVNNQKTITSIK